MEILMIAFVVALPVGAWLARRRGGLAPRIEPWAILAGVVVLLVLAWGTGADAKGAQIIVTMGALLGAWRAFQLLTKEGKDRSASAD